MTMTLMVMMKLIQSITLSKCTKGLRKNYRGKKKKIRRKEELRDRRRCKN
jgi:hypothetical protein